MTEQMMTAAQLKTAAYNRQQTVLVRVPVSQVSNRVTLHPHYVARRRSDGRSLAHHALGTLLVLGALVLMANV